MKGFKVFNPDWTCRGFIYAVGNTYTHEGTPVPCQSGFHFCENWLTALTITLSTLLIKWLKLKLSVKCPMRMTRLLRISSESFVR